MAIYSMHRLVTYSFVFALAACGGGGGSTAINSGSTSNIVNTDSLTVVARTTSGANLVNAMATGDLNGDGLDDIVVGGWVNDGTHTAQIYVFYQNQDGSLTEKTTDVLSANTYNGSQHIFIADFDNDGKNDIIFPGFDDGSPQPPANTLIFWNNAGQFIRQDLNDQVYAHGACYDDLDGDGDLDMLVAGGGVYLNQGNRVFQIRSNILPNNFFSTCSIIRNQNNSLNILLGNDNQLVGSASEVLTLNSSFNITSQAALPLPNPSAVDLINSLVLDVDNDGNMDFIAIFNQMAPGVPGAKQVLLNDGNGGFVSQAAFDTLGNNAYYTYTFLYGNLKTVLFGAGNGDVKLYQINNNVLTLFKQDVLEQIASSLGVTQGNWNTGHGTIYKNNNNGKVFFVQYINGIYYSREI